MDDAATVTDGPQAGDLTPDLRDYASSVDLTGIRHPKKRAFLAAYVVTGSIRKASGYAGIHRKTHYNWMESDERYAEAFKQAMEDAADVLEEEARRRAVEGVTDPVYYKGQVVGYRRTYSDMLLMAMLNGRRPDVFQRNGRVEVTGAGGGPVELDAPALRRLADNLTQNMGRLRELPPGEE